MELEGSFDSKENELAEIEAIDLIEDEGLTLVEDGIEDGVDGGVTMIFGIIEGLFFIGFSHETIVSKS